LRDVVVAALAPGPSAASIDTGGVPSWNKQTGRAVTKFLRAEYVEQLVFGVAGRAGLVDYWLRGGRLVDAGMLNRVLAGWRGIRRLAGDGGRRGASEGEGAVGGAAISSRPVAVTLA